MLFTLALALSLRQQSPVDYSKLYDTVKAKHEACFKDLRVDMKAWQPFAVETLTKTDFSKMTGGQLIDLYDLDLFTDLPGEADDAALAAFVKMAKARPDTKSDDVLLKFILTAENRDPAEQAELGRLYVLLTTQPMLGEIAKGKHFDSFLSGVVYYVPSAILRGNPVSAKNLLAILPQPWPTSWGTISEQLWSGVFTEANVGASDREKARAAAADAITRAIKEEKGERTRNFLTNAYSRMTGAAAMGKLIGQPMKSTNMIWSSDPNIKKFEDLKGRVVVLDFWATWCGPCIASIPKLKETVAKYHNYPVTVLGVTSIQGQVMGLESKPVDVTGNESKEFELTKQVADKLQMTWPVVFTKENVYNPEFGIRGIPFTAIIDPKGIVRYIGLHPSNDHEKIEKLVDTLLIEFKLPHPIEE